MRQFVVLGGKSVYMRCFGVLMVLVVVCGGQLSLSLFELKPRFVKGLKRLEAHFIKMVKNLKLYHKILGLSSSSLD